MFLIPFVSYSQFWVEENATWHYDFWNIGTSGFYKVNHTGEVTLGSEVCQEYVVDSYSFYYYPFNGGSYVYSGTNTIRTEYLHTSNDTVYRWDGASHRVLFDFGAQLGEEWIFDVNPNPLGLNCSDTSRVVVTDVGIENIDGVDYRYIELSSPIDSYYSLNGHFNERFAEDYPFPEPQNCDPTVAVEFDMVGNIRCFEDDSLSLNFVSEECEYMLIHAGLKEELNDVEVYPNPTSGSVFINNADVSKIKIRSGDGRMVNVLEFEKPVEKFSIESLKSGVYFLNLYSQKGQIFVKKIVLQKTE